MVRISTHELQQFETDRRQEFSVKIRSPYYSSEYSSRDTWYLNTTVHFVVALRYVLDFTTPLYLSRSISSNVTSVNTALQQCTGKVVRLYIQFEITYSTTVIEFNTTMALVVLMERCNFVNASAVTIGCTEAAGDFTL